MNQAELMQLDMEGMLQVSEVFYCCLKIAGRWMIFSLANVIFPPFLTVFSDFGFQHFQKVIPHQFDSGPDKLIQTAYQIKYNAKKMKK